MNPNPMHGRAKIARIWPIAQIATPLGGTTTDFSQPLQLLADALRKDQ